MDKSISVVYFKPITGCDENLEKVSGNIFKIFNIKNISCREHAIPGEIYYITNACGINIEIKHSYGDCPIDGYEYSITIQALGGIPDRTFLHGVADVFARKLLSEGYDVIRVEWIVDKPEVRCYRYKNTYDTYPEEPEKWVTVEPIELPPETLGPEA